MICVWLPVMNSRNTLFAMQNGRGNTLGHNLSTTILFPIGLSVITELVSLM